QPTLQRLRLARMTFVTTCNQQWPNLLLEELDSSRVGLGNFGLRRAWFSGQSGDRCETRGQDQCHPCQQYESCSLHSANPPADRNADDRNRYETGRSKGGNKLASSQRAVTWRAGHILGE